ncbi:MAG: hypothetical protein WC796_04275 [Candidatus Pacearchaeota archaeon]|jgi:hypothetical protein
MKHISSLCKGVENAFRRSSLGDAIIQVYRMLQMDVGPNENEKCYAYHPPLHQGLTEASTIRAIEWRAYPVGTGPQDFVEPIAEGRNWK